MLARCPEAVPPISEEVCMFTQAFTPVTYGPSTSSAALRWPGKHSGRNALRTRLAQLGFELPPEQLDDVFKRFKVRCSAVQRKAWTLIIPWYNLLETFHCVRSVMCCSTALHGQARLPGCQCTRPRLALFGQTSC